MSVEQYVEIASFLSKGYEGFQANAEKQFSGKNKSTPYPLKRKHSPLLELFLNSYKIKHKIFSERYEKGTRREGVEGGKEKERQREKEREIKEKNKKRKE